MDSNYLLQTPIESGPQVSPFIQVAPIKLAPFKFAFVKSVFSKFAPCKLDSYKLALIKLIQEKFRMLKLNSS